MWNLHMDTVLVWSASVNASANGSVSVLVVLSSAFLKSQKMWFFSFF